MDRSIKRSANTASESLPIPKTITNGNGFHAPYNGLYCLRNRIDMNQQNILSRGVRIFEFHHIPNCA